MFLVYFGIGYLAVVVLSYLRFKIDYHQSDILKKPISDTRHLITQTISAWLVLVVTVLVVDYLEPEIIKWTWRFAGMMLSVFTYYMVSFDKHFIDTYNKARGRHKYYLSDRGWDAWVKTIFKKNKHYYFAKDLLIFISLASVILLYYFSYLK